MAEILGKWPSKRGPISKIDCGRDAVLLALERWYDFHKPSCYPGNIDLNWPWEPNRQTCAEEAP